MALGHGKVWESLLVAGGIIFAVGVIWGAFLLARRFAEVQGAIVLVALGVILLVVAETTLLEMEDGTAEKVSRRK